jgi:hypothetical protein
VLATDGRRAFVRAGDEPFPTRFDERSAIFVFDLATGELAAKLVSPELPGRYFGNAMAMGPFGLAVGEPFAHDGRGAVHVLDPTGVSLARTLALPDRARTTANLQDHGTGAPRRLRDDPDSPPREARFHLGPWTLAEGSDASHACRPLTAPGPWVVTSASCSAARRVVLLETGKGVVHDAFDQGDFVVA